MFRNEAEIVEQKNKKNPVSKLIKIIIFLSLFLVILCIGCNILKIRMRTLSSKEYDAVISSGDQYNLVYKRVDTLEGSYDMMGVLDGEGEWIQPLSKNHVFIDEYSKVKSYQYDDENTLEVRIENMKNDICYMGEGMFMFLNDPTYEIPKGIMYNAEKNISFDIGEYYYADKTTIDVHGPVKTRYRKSPTTVYQDGYWIMLGRSDRREGWYIKIIDKVGNITETDLRGEHLGQYSEGLFYLDKYFYDINLKKCIDLSEYNILNLPFFENEKAQVNINNGDGVKYRVEIDKNGKFLGEPKKVN